jgi:hypothetical protein
MLQVFGIGAGSLSPKMARAQWCLLRICNKTSIYLRFPWSKVEQGPDLSAHANYGRRKTRKRAL